MPFDPADEHPDGFDDGFDEGFNEDDDGFDKDGDGFDEVEPLAYGYAPHAPPHASTHAPPHASTRAPTHASTRAPTRASTRAPTRASTRAPARASTRAPTRASTRAGASEHHGGDYTVYSPLFDRDIAESAVIFVYHRKGGTGSPLLTNEGHPLQLAPIATLDDLLPHVYETGLYHLVARVATHNHRLTAHKVVPLHVPYRPRPAFAAPTCRCGGATDGRASRPLGGEGVSKLLREQITELRAQITRLEGDVDAARRERDAAISRAAAWQVRIAQLDTSNGHLASQLAERPAGSREEDDGDFSPLDSLTGLNSVVDHLARRLSRLGESEAAKASTG